MAFGIVWMVSQAFVPAAIGRAIDTGVAQRDGAALLVWSAIVFGLGVLQAVAGIFRHRCAVSNWLTAAYRTVQVTVRHTATLGATLPKRMATGEVVSIGATDIAQIGNATEISARMAGAVVAFAVVAVILLRASVPLGLLVLIGVPALMLVIAPLLRPLHHRQHAQRELTGELATHANDIVAGLRVLRGVGGEDAFADRFRVQSQKVRRAGVRVAGVESLLDATQILLPGIFVVMVTWLGARFALAGKISAGELVAFYGYAAFLVSPLRTATEAADKVTRGLVASRRIVRLLGLRPEIRDPATPQPVPAPVETGAAELVDVTSGLAVPAGTVTAVACADPADATALADRLGRYTDGEVRWRGVPLDRLAVAAVREHILIADSGAQLFSGVLRDELDRSGTADDATIDDALAAASAHDVVAALPDGLAEEVDERGRSFSGGQRQRLILARALIADPDVLVLVEPTSAVDAHTEARIAERLAPARAGRTTVVFSTSPLVLDRADRVAYVAEGAVVAEGGHRQLLATDARYRAVVTRGEADE